jgi:hypothetical protein
VKKHDTRTYSGLAGWKVGTGLPGLGEAMEWGLGGAANNKNGSCITLHFTVLGSMLTFS